MASASFTLPENILVFAILLFLAFLVIKYAVKAGMDASSKQVADREWASHRAPQAGRYCVRGVDRSTKLETSAYYEAATPAIAKAKAELDGIVVTEVEFDR